MKSQLVFNFFFTLIILTDSKHFLVKTEGDDESRIFSKKDSERIIMKRILNPFMGIIKQVVTYAE